MASQAQRKVPVAHTIKEIGGSPQQNALMEKIVQAFTITPEYLEKITQHFLSEMHKGLNHEEQTIAMIPSFVEGRLTGEETGQFLALDLGGTNLRVVLVELQGRGKFTTKSTKYKVSESLKTGDVKDLYNFIADSIDSFLTEHNLDYGEADIHLGYTFSFPVYQSKINRGLQKQWTKGFNCLGAIGKDPVILLQDALAKKHVPVLVSALVNDTVGTLLSNAYSKPDTNAGIILGTGSNGAYVEKMSNIQKWKGGPTSSDEMIINMEFGAFDNERVILPVTPWDNKLDRESINPHKQIFEKMISGMYLGEITRNVLIEWIDRALLFEGYSSKEFNSQWGFETTYMSTIEADQTPNLKQTHRVLSSSLNIPNVSEVDCRIVKRVCDLVGTRAARLAAAAIAGIVRQCRSIENGCDIGIDGSLYEFYPSFEQRIEQGLRELFPNTPDINKKIRLGLAKDGSGVGAALCACVAKKMAERRKSQ
ncbi:hexokinase-domain-containing protein [Umbelopsis sp. PMI_123]|nr:hexokinase-domain-containing protein [Umbelopsis sp. PMI_123]